MNFINLKERARTAVNQYAKPAAVRANLFMADKFKVRLSQRKKVITVRYVTVEGVRFEFDDLLDTMYRLSPSSPS